MSRALRDVLNSGEFRREWKVAVAGFLGNALGVGAMLYFGLASFVRPMERELGWSRLEVSFAATLFTLSSMLALPLVGRLCDRFGPRGVVLPSIIGLTLALAAISVAPAHLWLFYVVCVVGSLVGAGTLGLTYAAAISRAFDVNRGFALGISLSGAGLAAFALPLLLHELIERYGWRMGWLALAALALVQLPVASRFLPRRDREVVVTGNVSSSGRAVFLRLLATRCFWYMTLPFCIVSGFLVNMIALLTDRGLSNADAAVTASLIGIGILVARLTVGFVVDLVAARWVAALVFVLAAGGSSCLLYNDATLAAAGAFLLGFTTGAEYDLLAFMASRYFGRREQNSVLGASLSLFNAGAVLSPILVGRMYEATGSYDNGLVIVILGCLLAAAIVTLIGPYPEAGTVVNSSATDRTDPSLPAA
jgi:MFS family permease